MWSIAQIAPEGIRPTWKFLEKQPVTSITSSSEILKPQVTTHILLNIAFPKDFCWPPVNQRLLTQQLLWPEAAQVDGTATPWTKAGATTHSSSYVSHPWHLHAGGSEAQILKEHLLVWQAYVILSNTNTHIAIGSWTATNSSKGDGKIMLFNFSPALCLHEARSWSQQGLRSRIIRIIPLPLDSTLQEMI